MTRLPNQPKITSGDTKSNADGLSQRGQELAASGATLDKFKTILGDQYDPDTNPGGIVNIGTAENYIMLDEAAAFADKNVEAMKPEPKDFSYGQGPWGTPRLREAMAKHINRLFHPLKPVEARRILFANGVTSLCEMLGFTICGPGDAILLSRPIYQAFKADFGSKARVQCVYTTFGDIDQFSPEGISKYEEAIIQAEKEGKRIRALIACSPHNPLGRCYPRESLIAFMQLCNKYKIHLLVDEIYALSVYDVPDPKAVEFCSVLTLDTDKYIDPRYLHLLYGMSKDMAGGGLRLGCIYTQNEQLLRAMSVISSFHWSGSANEKIAAVMLENTEWMDGFLALSRKRLAAGNVMVRKILDEAGIGYYKGSNAGLFIWVDLRPYLPKLEGEDGWAAEDMLTSKLIKNGVFLTNGKDLSAEQPGWYRLIFSQEERVVREGIKRMLEVVEGKA